MSVAIRRGVIGIVKGSGDTETFQERGNFSLEVVAKVEGALDGYLARITRAPDGVSRDCFFHATDAMRKNDFIHRINSGFGSGGMFSTLSDVDLGNYLLGKVMQFMSGGQARTLSAVQNVGQQDGDPPVFLLSSELHLNEEGYEIDQDQRRSYFHVTQIEPRLMPSIQTPYVRSCTGILNLWGAIETAAQHNRGSALFTFGAVAMNLHFQTLVELKGGAPVVVLYGEPDVGKTTIANAAMSVLGIEACSFRGMRREYFIHLASKTSLGLMYDDPNKISEVENIIIDFYNGMTRGGFKRGLETPQCGFLLACNFTLGKIQRLLSRVVIIPFSGPGIQARTPEQRQAFSALKRLKSEASSSIGFFISMGKRYREVGAFEVDDYEQRLLPLLPTCSGRTLKGYANLIWFTEQVADLIAKDKEEVWKQFTKFAPQLDQLQQKGESIADAPVDEKTKSSTYWEKVGSNLLELARKCNSHHQVRSFLQIGTQERKPSVSVAMDAAVTLMGKNNITPKFTLNELRDAVSNYNCGVRGQSRPFHMLNKDLSWSGKCANIKVPVIRLEVFPPQIADALAKCISPSQFAEDGTTQSTSASVTAITTVGSTDPTATTSPASILISSSATTSTSLQGSLSPTDVNLFPVNPEMELRSSQSLTLVEEMGSPKGDDLPEVPLANRQEVRIPPPLIPAEGDNKRKDSPGKKRSGKKCDEPAAKRPTRSNTTVPNWSVQINPKNPLGL